MSCHFLCCAWMREELVLWRDGQKGDRAPPSERLGSSGGLVRGPCLQSGRLFARRAPRIVSSSAILPASPTVAHDNELRFTPPSSHAPSTPPCTPPSPRPPLRLPSLFLSHTLAGIPTPARSGVAHAPGLARLHPPSAAGAPTRPRRAAAPGMSPMRARASSTSTMRPPSLPHPHPPRSSIPSRSR